MPIWKPEDVTLESIIVYFSRYENKNTRIEHINHDILATEDQIFNSQKVLEAILKEPVDDEPENFRKITLNLIDSMKRNIELSKELLGNLNKAKEMDEMKLN